MIVKLIGRTEPVAGREFPVGDVLRVGAAPSNDARISAVGVSRTHARLWREGKWFWIEDTGSTNGTFLNGQRIERDRLRHLDVVTLGRNVDLIFVCRAGEQPEPPHVGILSASLTMTDGPDAGSSIDVPKGEITLGRSPSCEVVIDSSIVSKVHARIQRTLELVTIQDLGSANGTFVNDQRLTSPTVLTDGDRISLAGVRTLTVRIARDPAAMPARLQQPITGPVQVFDQEWKTRLVWSPQELEEIERFKAEIAPARQTVAAQAAPKPAAAKPPAPAKAVAERPAVEKPPAPEKPAVAAKQEAPPPKPAMKPEAPKPVAMAPKPEAPAKPAPPPPAAAKPAPAQPKPPVPSPPKPAAPPAVVAETGNEETIGIAMAPPIRLVRLKGDAGSFTLEQGTFAVGRSMAAAVRVDNRELSRNHASIVVTPTTVSVEDQGSANGTFVNDVEAKGRQPLGQGDRVAFGSVVFTVDIERKS